jgi:hypothetical protein
MFIERCWFIVKNFDKYEYEELEALSYLWVNKKYLKCEYSKDLMDTLASCNSVYDNIQ